jgi:hypothetical protein
MRKPLFHQVELVEHDQQLGARLPGLFHSPHPSKCRCDFLLSENAQLLSGNLLILGTDLPRIHDALSLRRRPTDIGRTTVSAPEEPASKRRTPPRPGIAYVRLANAKRVNAFRRISVIRNETANRTGLGFQPDRAFTEAGAIVEVPTGEL